MKLIQAIIALVGLTAATPVAYLPNVNNAVQPHDEPALGADSHMYVLQPPSLLLN